MKVINISETVLFLIMLGIVSATSVQAQSSNAVETLNQSTNSQPSDADFQQAVSDYQQSPSQTLAEKVIKLARTMDQLPPIPEEARGHFVKGKVILESAKDAGDFSLASQEFLQAARLAPWWPEARRCLAVTMEAAGAYTNAIVNLKLYQQFKLADTESRDAQDEIYKIEAKQEMAAKEQAIEAQVAAQKQAEEQQQEAERQKASEPRFEGAWYWKSADGSWETYRIGPRDYGLALPFFVIVRDSSGQFTVTRPPQLPSPPPGYLNEDNYNTRYDNVRVEGRLIHFRKIGDAVYTNGTRSIGMYIEELTYTLSEDNDQLVQIEDIVYQNGREVNKDNSHKTLYRKEN